MPENVGGLNRAYIQKGIGKGHPNSAVVNDAAVDQG